jgi:hypothetical protein
MLLEARQMEAQGAPGERQSLSLDGLWQFRHEDGAWREAVVPGPWQAQFPDLAHASGRTTYLRQFTVPSAWQGREIALHFGAVSYFCEVLLNGVSLGSHEGGYLSFSFVLPPDLLEAENEIEVRVVLPNGDRDAYPDFPFGEIPHGKQSWYGPLGGLWQSVRIEARDPVHVSHASIRADAAGRLAVTLESSRAAAGQKAVLTVRGADDRELAVAEVTLSGEDEVALRVDNPALWSIDAPNLHTLEIETIAGGVVVDRIERTFGFRTIETRDGKILLNGEPVYMRAALDQDYYPEGICTPPSLEFLEDQAQKAKHLGLNTLRCHIKVPDPRYYDVADRLGLLVWTEIPNVATFTDKSAARMRETMAGILRRDANHPSIVCWTIINEDWGTRLVENADHRAWLKDTYDWLKAEDPTRLVVDNSPCFPNFHVKTDLNDYHYYRSVPERRREWDEITREFAAGAQWTWSGLGDAERRGDEPLIVSEFGVWGLPDPSKLRGEDGVEPFWFETGATWGDGVALPHGVEQRFATLDLAKTFGGFDAFITAVQWYQFANLKYQIETMRRHDSIMGYVMTELTDVHWEANGLLDIARNPRVFHDEFAGINADIVIVPRPRRYAAWAGETLDVELSVATGGETLPDGAELVWSGTVSGRCRVPAAGPVTAIDLGTHGLAMPQTPTNRMLRIDFTLEAGGKVLARNSLDIALYAERHTDTLPTISCADAELAAFAEGLGYRVVPQGQGDITLAHALSTADIEAMRAGARYLVLADGSARTNRNLRTDIPEGEALYRAISVDGEALPNGSEQQLPGIGLVPRDGTIWRGDWIAGFSWIRREGAFASLPGGPLIDLSFSDVVPHHVLTGFRTWEYGSAVKAGVVVGWVHKPAALIAERRVGRGGLVATSFRLTHEAPDADPVAAALFDALAATATAMAVET